MIRYAITSGQGASLKEFRRLARKGAATGISYIQLREKFLAADALTEIARAMAEELRQHGGHTKLLVNSRADVALVAGADGVHLTSRSGELTPTQVRRLFAAAGGPLPILSIACHTLAEVNRAVADATSLILFGPVFEKRIGGEVVVPGVGLDALRTACDSAGAVPVLALGGVTAENAAACLAAGASGIAGIRLFADRQE
jgi:thiamine-phosphate pyrophosphorylase